MKILSIFFQTKMYNGFSIKIVFKGLIAGEYEDIMKIECKLKS